PVTERLVGLIYGLVNREYLWIARLLTTTFWLIGGIFLFKVAARIVSPEAAIFSTAYYLFVPLGVLASRSFQPDPLMIMMFLFGLFTIVQYYDQPSMIRLVIAASISGFAILIKPLVLFALLGAFVSLAIYRKGSQNRVIDGQLLIFTVVCLLPTVLYYGYGMFITDSLKSQAQGSFLPQLLLSQEYWKDWSLTAAGTVGYKALLAGLVGLPMLRKGMPRALLIGLWSGYIIFGLVFTNHIRFVNYYHLQLIVIVALSFAPIAALVMNNLKQATNPWYWWLPVAGAFLLAFLFSIREVRSQQLAIYRTLERVETAQEIGKIVGHSSKNVYLASHYGMPLEYYGELTGTYWPRRLSDPQRALGLADEYGASVEERLRSLGFSPEYFIITQFDQLNRYHPDLKEYLVKNCPLLTESDEYLIYGACTK
ncbi:MAG: hypothetical protein GWN00_24210, partial [Aliifodinibius sp.]|nr:hypothetical protein [Fodinibius sp.]NIW99150.1 hypothetical protein [Phycisphaerae bacterium]NIY27792.1 hypothetical protein [Fodinibius sp.]